MVLRRVIVGGMVLAALLLAGLLTLGDKPAGVPAATAAAQTPAAPSVPLTRYSIVHGCFNLSSPVTGRALGGGAGPFRMQATALGSYLLYGVRQDFLTDPSTGATASQPSDATTWVVAGPPFTITNKATGVRVPVNLEPAAGCAVYPEAQVDATGTPFSGASPTSTVMGTIDAHTHITAFDFLGGDWHCGKPWDPFGAPFALPNCKQYEQGSNGAIESFIDFGGLGQTPADMAGWPTFVNWPGPTKLAEEGDYYTGIKRAWMAGVRVIVTQLVDNEELCQLMTMRRNPCVDAEAVDIQARDLHALQDYIDAQSGGPGKGFFRIVTNPFQARQVINEGKLAIVMGIEASHTFDCGNAGQSNCTPAFVDAALAHFKSLGVSTFFPVHKFDNAFGGAKMDSGEFGVLINFANKLTTGHFFDVQTCNGSEHDNTQITEPASGSLLSLLTGPLRSFTGGATIPDYPPPPHCNQLGLTSIGAYLINQMIKQHFIVELDHMDAKTADDALAIIEAHHYSGVISAHSWDSPQENVGIYNDGGFVTPIAGASPQAFIDQWKATRTIRNKRFYAGAGFGYGADMNGLADESQPTNLHPIAYPFKSFDGKVTFAREVWGQRTFDINKDGVANYGMFPDWMQELQTVAGPGITADMFRGAEAYLEMWERAYAVPMTTCRSPAGTLGPSGNHLLALGEASQPLLYALGQPSSRPGNAFRYCVAGSPGSTVAAVFTAAGNVGLWVANAPGYATGAGIKPGQPVVRLSGRAAALGSGLWLGPRLRGGSRYVYVVRGGRISFVGVAVRSVAAHTATLRAALSSAGVS